MPLILWFSALLLIVIVVLLAAAWQEKDFSIDKRHQLNTEYYHQQANELSAQVASYEKHQRPAILCELDQRLLTDISDRDKLKIRTARRWVLMPAVILLIIMTPLLYLHVSGAEQWLRWKAIIARYPKLRERLLNPAETNLTSSELAQFSVGLRQALSLHPHDGDNWGMFARLALAFNQPETSRLAFEQAMRLQPENRELKLEYATLLVRSPIQADNQQAVTYLKKLLAENTKESRIINLVAANFYSLKNYSQAIYYWQKLLVMYPQASAESNEIRRAIAKARSESGQIAKILHLELTLSPQASKQIDRDDRLYISVSNPVSQQVVASKQLPLRPFPVQVVLNDSDSSMEDRLLSTWDRIQVTVMIAKVSDTVSTPAAWFAKSKVMEFNGNQRVKLELVKN